MSSYQVEISNKKIHSTDKCNTAPLMIMMICWMSLRYDCFLCGLKREVQEEWHGLGLALGQKWHTRQGDLPLLEADA